MGFEKAESLGFWEQSRKEMMGKVERFCAVFDELGLPVRIYIPFSSYPFSFFLFFSCSWNVDCLTDGVARGIQYSKPEGGYFVLANFARVNLPADYVFPPQVADRPRDYKLAWFLIMELGLAAIPPTEFYTRENMWMAEDWLRFAVCKDDVVLEGAKERLRGLRKYMS